MLRGDSAFGTKKVMTTCVEEGVEFSLSVARNKRISTAIGGIDESVSDGLCTGVATLELK